jgi:phospholipid transport system substrate-binding protein
VRSKLVTLRGTEVPIDYRLQKGSSRLRAYDVLVEGVSLVQNYRSQFNRIITQSSYDELIKRLEQKRLEVAEEERTRRPGTKTP